MSKARKEAAKKKSVAQKAATRAKKLQNLGPVACELSTTNHVRDDSAAQELFLRATTKIDTATTDADFAAAIEASAKASNTAAHHDFGPAIGLLKREGEQFCEALAAHLAAAPTAIDVAEGGSQASAAG